MYLILNDNIIPVSYSDIPYAYRFKGNITVWSMPKEDFELLLKCDGHTYLEHSESVDRLLERRFCKECEKGTELPKWQKPKFYRTRYMPKMNLQISGKCNYNCIHCFNAKDNAPLQAELTLNQIQRLLDECNKCGIRAFTITGGEPMVHPHYKEIIEEIYKRGMIVFELNTNGFYITREMLDWMKSINYQPLIKISYDGIGFHNWMRGSSSAEEKTLQAIKLCQDAGFNVKIQMNVNNKNVSSILPSLIMLDEMGVKETRLIKTTNAPRWLSNAGEDSMTIEEYYDAALIIIKEYLSSERQMDVTGWLIFHVDPQKKYYNLSPISCRNDEYTEEYPLCNGASRMIAVGSNGNVYPCLQCQGWFDKNEIILGNVISDGLENILTDSKYLEMISLTTKDRINTGSSCKECEFLKTCTGGCPAMAILTSGDYLLPDLSKCIFFKKGYYQKFVDAFPPEYENIRPL